MNASYSHHALLVLRQIMIVAILFTLISCDDSSGSSGGEPVEYYVLVKAMSNDTSNNLVTDLYVIDPKPPYESKLAVYNIDRLIEMVEFGPPTFDREGFSTVPYAAYVKDGNIELLDLNIKKALATSQISNLENIANLCNWNTFVGLGANNLRDHVIEIFPEVNNECNVQQGFRINLAMNATDTAEPVVESLFTDTLYIFAAAGYDISSPPAANTFTSNDLYSLKLSNNELYIRKFNDKNYHKTLLQNVETALPLWASGSFQNLNDGLYYFYTLILADGALYALETSTFSLVHLRDMAQTSTEPGHFTSLIDFSRQYPSFDNYLLDEGSLFHINSTQGQFGVEALVHIPKFSADAVFVGANDRYLLLSQGTLLQAIDPLSGQIIQINNDASFEFYSSSENRIVLTGANNSVKIVDYSGTVTASLENAEFQYFSSLGRDYYDTALSTMVDGNQTRISLYNYENPSHSIILGTLPSDSFDFVNSDIRTLSTNRIFWSAKTYAGTKIFVTDFATGTQQEILQDISADLSIAY